MYKRTLLILFIQHIFCENISTNNAGEILLKLVHQAVKPHKEFLKDNQQRQNHHHQGYGFLHGYHENNNLFSHSPYLSSIPSYPNNLIVRPSYIDRNPQTFTEILETIAINDKLHCIPRLLCEITSGYTTLTNSKQPFLPFRIDLDSLQQVLSTLNIIDVSPIVTFGTAALIGMSSNGNNNRCIYSYPKCPTDPDDLVYYLNNYNGGFFRYFNGINTAYRPTYTYADKYINYDNGRNDIRNTIRNERNLPNAEKRILTKPYDEFYSKLLTQNIKFPREYVDINTYSSIKPYKTYQYKSEKTLVFPDYKRESNQQIFKGSYRERKGFSFPTDKNNELIFQKPLPNYLATHEIFPDRTGTGELIVDSEQFYK